MGSGMGEAYQGGATDWEALKHGLNAGALDAGSELLFGGLGKGANALGYSKGLSSLDDMAAKALTKNISKPALRNFASFAIKSGFEGVEEVISGFGQAISKHNTFRSEEEFLDILEEENLLEQFVIGTLASGVMQSGVMPGMRSGSLVEANQTGTDFITGFTQNEQAVIKKETENRIAELEANGTKLTQKEKSAIEAQVEADLEKGRISIGTIEEALGGDTYQSYMDTVNSEDSLFQEYDTLNKMKQGDMTGEQVDRRNELKQQLEDIKKNAQRESLKNQLSSEVFNIAKNDRLVTSYNETAKRSQAYEADLSQYDEKQQATIQRAIDSGILNNTGRTHEFVDMIAKISADKGVLFDFTNNENLKNSGFAIDGKQVNGYVTKDGVTLNIESAKSLNSVVGHEVTHVLEGTEVYTELQKIITEYAKSKGEYQSRYDALVKLYENIKDADIDAELTADLVGDYLFTDADFVKNLSVKNRNLFQKIYDEIKYLCKIATAGSKEARKLEKVKKTFEKAYKEGGKKAKEGEKASGGTKYHLDNNGQEVYNIDSKNEGGNSYARTDEFRQLQEEVRRMPSEESELFHRGSKEIDDGVRNRVSGILRTQIDTARNGLRNGDGLLTLSDKKTSNQFNIHQNVNGELFHDVFEIARSYLRNGELVDLHTVKTTDDGLGYDDCTNYLSDDGMSGFSITPDGDLISVFNLNNKKGFLHAISEFVNGKAKTLDCYNSSAQPLPGIYSKVLGFKTASVMDYNMEYDHDNIAANHGMPQVAFMVKTDADVETRHFTKDQYDDALEYRNSYVQKGDVKFSVSDTDGKQLSKGQQDYFKDSKMRDENGNLKVMYHGSENGGFHQFNARFSDDNTSFFFVDSPDVAGSYSGSSEVYTAKTLNTPEDFRNFLREIGENDYEVVGNDGDYRVLDVDGDTVAKSDTMRGLYDEFCDYMGIGEGAVNYKVYLNLTNPHVVDAGGSNWDNVTEEFSQELFDNYKSLTPDEMVALEDLAEWQDVSVFRDEILDAVRAKRSGLQRGEHIQLLADAYNKLRGPEGVDLYRLFNIATDGFRTESLYENATEKWNTRKHAEWAKQNGYDGVIFKNIVDIGGFGNVKSELATVAVAFDSNQIKSVANENPTTDADIRYSLSDNQGNAVAPAMQKRLADSKARDENGSLKVLYHGTYNGDFSIFDKSKGSVEGDFGSGFYFTDNEADVESNYEGGGPDYENKVLRRAEQIENEQDVADLDEAIEIARGEMFKGGKKFECYLDIKNPAIVGETILLDGESIRENYDIDDYDSEEDYYADLDQAVSDEVDSIVWDVEKNVDVDHTNGLAEILFDAIYEGGIGVEELKAKINDLYLEDSEGNYVGNEVARQVIESLGYDGIIDSTVSSKFRNMGMEEGTTHYIVFKPNQIKAITNQNPTDNPDIHRSLSETDGRRKQYGNYNVYGNDISLDIAPVAENVVDTKSATTTEMFPDDLAPIDSELDHLLLVKLGLENDMRSAMAVGDGVAFEEINREYEATMDRIAELEKEANAADAGRLNSLDDSLVPPERFAYPEDMQASDTTRLKDKAVNSIVRTLKERGFLSKNEVGAMKDVVQNFSTADIQSKQELFDEIKEKFGVREWSEKNEYLAEVKRELRTRGVKVSDTIKHEIADYTSFMRHNFGKIRFSKDGLAVDELYHELNEMYPDQFPDNIYSPTDQLLQMDSVANQDIFVKMQDTMDDAEIQEAVDFIYEETSRFKAEEQAKANDRFVGLLDSAPPDDFAPVAETVKPAAKAKPAEPVATKNPVFNEQLTMWGEEKKNPNTNVAEILDTEPKTNRDRRSRAWAKFVAAVVDKGAVFENLSLKTKNRQLMGDWQKILYSQGMAQHFIGNGDGDVPSLTSIQEKVTNSGKKKAFEYYLYHMHNVDRMTLAERFPGMENKAVFGDTITAEESRQTAALYENANPEFKEWAEEVYSYNQYLRDMLVENDVISEATAELWEKMYPHYVPIRREGDTGLNVNVPLDSNKTGVNAPVKRATGGSRNILPVFDTMAQRTLQTFKAVAKNQFGIELKNTLGTALESEVETQGNAVDTIIDSLDAPEGLLKEGMNGMNPTFTVFENGERVEFEITPDMYDALKPVSEAMMYTNKVLNTAGKIQKGLLTEYNPVFMLTNAIKDSQDILINSQHPAQTYAKIPEAYAQILSKGYWYEEYVANGGEQNSYFDNETNSFKTESALSKVIKFPLTAISKLNNVIEMAPRLAEYIASRENGQSTEVSMLDAARVTTNFSASGDFAKLLNRNGCTFLTASISGASQQVRNVREAINNGPKGVAKLITRFALAGLPALLLNGLLWKDDEEYEELSDYVKQNYYVIGKTADGKFIRIPKGRTVAVLQSGIEQFGNMVTGNDEADWGAFAELFFSNLAPNNPLDNNIVAPIVQALRNKTWYGEDLVPSRLQDVPVAEQYDESTDSFSRWLGGVLNISPYKINYVLNQYSGGVGDVLLPMLTPEAESGDDSFLGTLLAPLRDKFTTDAVLNSGNPSDFYEMRDQITVNANSSNATEDDAMKALYFDSVSWEMSDLYKQKREIQNSDLPDSVKYQRVREIQEQINTLARDALSDYNNVSVDGMYAEVGSKRYNYDEENQRWYEIREKNSDGTDNYWYQQEQRVTKGLGITPAQYWNDREEYDFAYKYPEKYEFFNGIGVTYDDYASFDEDKKRAYTWAAQNPAGYEVRKAVSDDFYTSYQYYGDLYDIKADKDSRGKTINGSAKAKKIDYINDLDIEYGQKIILFKSLYNADDTYNYEIIDYLNSRDDISAQEMRTILVELGFNVDSEGNITWD